jgi:hypothetical protein
MMTAKATEDLLSAEAAVFWRAATARNSHKLTKAEQSAIEVYLLVNAINASASHSEKRYSFDPDHLGYVRRDLGAHQVYVPYHLAGVLPGEDDLREAIMIADALRLDPKGSVCLSGSTNYCGTLSEVGDLDLCEYYRSEIGQLSRHMLSKTDRELPTVVRIKVGSAYFAFPWSNCTSNLDRLLKSGTTKFRPARQSMLFALHASARFGGLPVTNKVLPIDPHHPNEGHAERSFVYQEAVITFNEPPPYGLVEPQQVGRYLGFLVTEARRNLRTRPLKALKRILSFARIVGAKNMEDDLLAVLNSPQASALARVRRQTEYKRLYGAASGQVRHRLDSALSSTGVDTISWMTDDNRGTQEIAELAKEIGMECLLEVDLILRNMRAGKGVTAT